VARQRSLKRRRRRIRNRLAAACQHDAAPPCDDQQIRADLLHVVERNRPHRGWILGRHRALEFREVGHQAREQRVVGDERSLLLRDERPGVGEAACELDAGLARHARADDVDRDTGRGDGEHGARQEDAVRE